MFQLKSGYSGLACVIFLLLSLKELTLPESFQAAGTSNSNQIGSLEGHGENQNNLVKVP